MYAEIRQAEDGLDLDHLSPVKAIRRIVEFTYNDYLEHEGIVRVVVAENQAGGRRLRKSRPCKGDIAGRRAGRRHDYSVRRDPG